MDVAAWLRNLGLGQYEGAFRDNSVDAELLPRLTAEDLKELGVASVGHRRKLLDAISDLRSAREAPALSAEAPHPATSSPAAAKPPPLRKDSAERRPITVMFCDLVGSTSLAAKLDAEDWRNLVNAYLDESSKAVTGFGGHVLKRLGDGLMALFGYPQAQENDAERAVRAALAIQHALADLNAKNAASSTPELKARIGIESGPVIVESTGEVFGDAPNVAARVQAAAEPGAVLVTSTVQRQVAGLFVAEDQGARELRGVSVPVQLLRIVRASGGGRKSGARTLTPFIGREEEVGTLARRWERAKGGEGQLVLIVGEPGLGKSRLVEEFHSQLTETPHTWSEWSASQLLQNTPLHPVAEWGRQRFGVDAPAAQRLADLENTLRLIGLDPIEYAPLLAPLVEIPLPQERAPKFAPEELRRRQLAAMTTWVLAGARSQPIALAFEDLHWADPTSLDLLRALAERGAQAPLLLLATTRPEFRPPWSLRSHHSVISLAPLDRAGVARMVKEISARHALSEQVIDGVSERTGGVPLFVEEVTRLLLERGEQGGVQAIPLTLQQSLAARLDRLGEAREIAQIGAVLGREFTYGLLLDVAAAHEAALNAFLDRLADADLLFVEGAPPEAKYRFKHALVQDAAYDSLLKSRRQALHRRTAELLCDNPERAAAEPEVIAHHFTQAGLDDLAIEWWGNAGDQALRRSAFQEAVAHLGKAIEMADKAAGHTLTPSAKTATASASQRLKLQIRMGQAMMWSRGFGSDESVTAFARARTLAAGADNPSERFDAYVGLFTGRLLRGELSSARETAESFLQEAENAGRMTEASIARRCVGQASLYQGDLIGACSNLSEALRTYDPERDRDAKFRFGLDEGAGATGFLTQAVWALGDIERARSLGDEALARADETAHAPTRATVYHHISLYHMLRGDPEAVRRIAKVLVDLSREHGMALYLAYGELYSTWARAQLDDRKTGLLELRRSVAAYVDHGNKLHAPLFNGLLAELEAEGDAAEGALLRIDEALALANETGGRWTDALLNRIRAAILLKRDPTNPGASEEAFLNAIAIAQAQKGRSFGLQAALALAKLYQSTGRPTDAHAVLAPALQGFAPTPEMPEIAEAMSLLAELQDIDEVKADVAQRRRMAHLQAAYGAALISARGYGAPETTEAFAKARESTAGEMDAPERLVADYGLWAGSYVRGELASMRIHAATFVRDVETRPDSPEAGIAHRVQGMTHYFAGEFIEAVRELERALALFEPGRDDLAVRFPPDPGVAPMIYLAFASWALGEIDRAVSSIEGVRTRMAELSHAPTLALGATLTTLFSLMRGDPARARSSVSELARIVCDHDLPLFRAFGEFLGGWATIDGGALADGLEAMRSGAESLRGQNAVVFDGLVKIALSEAEERAADPEKALAVLDEALATCVRAGNGAVVSLLHRKRGELLLRRHPADPAPAEDALRTAVVIAQRQGARGYELPAAVSLAKLYQSTGRSAEAHAILAPALNGFARTPAMPEIAEAEALLTVLGEIEEVKAEVAQRQRRLQLQTSYAQAVAFSKGFLAEETKAAFERASELVGHDGGGQGRFGAYYGRWIVSLTREQLDDSLAIAREFLKAAESEGGEMEVAAACRALGLSQFVAGDFRSAQMRLEQAMRLHRPTHDDESRRLFGFDPQAGAMAYLACVNLVCGEPSTGRELIDAAVSRANGLDHLPTRANTLLFKAIYEAMRGDPEATLAAGSALVATCRPAGLSLYLTCGEACVGWARARGGDLEGGTAAMRRSRESLIEQGGLAFSPFFAGLLAGLEAEAQRLDAASTLVEETLRKAAQTGSHFSDSILMRLRGDILLKGNPANRGPIEEAFRTAIAIAKQQGARSHELLAALALAKLYQSTARSFEAHAVLAPALEGFAPTAEMPEVAEAMSLAVRLA